MIPEDIISTCNINDKTLKDYLVNHFNRLSLQHYKTTQQLLSEDEIKNAIPNKITEFYKKPISNKKDDIKKDDWEDAFKSFIDTKYDVSTTPDTKFKDLMTSFTAFSGITVTCTWCAKYETLCQKLNIKFEKIVDPRFAAKGGAGTCHVYLRLKNYNPKQSPTTYKTGVIPDLF